MNTARPDCPLCPRLCGFRQENRNKFPDYHNAPVPSFGELDAALLVVGLAPGLHGANATGRPFTGDYAGVILYGALKKHGFAQGEYKQHAGDGFRLLNCRITNAVRCVPQANKPLPEEIRTCNAFLKSEIAAMPKLRAILSLGQISHNAVVRALELKASQHKFVHAAQHIIGKITLLNSYHTSRYNMNTRVLTEAMFDEVMAQARALVSRDSRTAISA